MDELSDLCRTTETKIDIHSGNVNDVTKMKRQLIVSIFEHDHLLYTWISFTLLAKLILNQPDPVMRNSYEQLALFTNNGPRLSFINNLNVSHNAI